MKNKFSYLAAILAAMAAVSCSSDIEEQISNTSSKKLVPMTFSASQEESDVTRTYIENTTGSNKVKWKNADAIAVYDGTTTNEFGVTSGGGTTSATLEGTVTSGSTDFNAVYPYSAADINYYGEISDIVIPDVQTATENTYDPDAAVMTATATSTDKNFAFKNACAFLKITTTTAYMKISVSVTTGTLSGSFTCSNYANAALEVMDGYGKKSVVLNPASGSTTFAKGTYYIAVAPGSLEGLSVKCYTSANEYYERTLESATLVQSKYYSLGTVSTSSSNWTKHTLTNGGYSVSDSKKVMFTTGNLYWDGSAYHIESSQIGGSRDSDGDPTIDDTHLSYFYWTNITDYTSGNSKYMPYATYYQCSAQLTTDKFWCGVDNPLTVDGTSNLYVLTNDEWIYLIKYRVNADNLYKYNVTVTDGDNNTYTNCIVIAPDDFDFTSHPLQSSYTLDEITSLGITCLPAMSCTIDYRSKYKIFYPDELGYGCYWTASPVEDEINVDNAYDFDWSDHDISTETGVAMELRSFGECIRLVYTYTGE